MSDFETVAVVVNDATAHPFQQQAKEALSRIEAELTRLREEVAAYRERREGFTYQQDNARLREENERLAVEHHGDTDVLHSPRRESGGRGR